MKSKDKLALLAGVLSVFLAGCTVDKNYTLENLDSIDSEMTFFQNGLTVPIISSTVELRADSLLNRIDDPEIKRIFSLTKDGKYQIGYDGYENLDSFIKDLDLENVFTIDRVNAEKNLRYEFKDLRPATVKSDSQLFKINETIDLEFLRSKDLSDILVSIGTVNLKNVTANLGLVFQGLPSIGSSSKHMLDLKAELPDFVKPSTISISGEIRNGQPINQLVNISSFNLSGYDFPQMKSKGESLKGKIKITGRVYVTNPESIPGTLSGTVDCKTTTVISGPNNKIKAKDLSARVDCKIDTTFFVEMKGLYEQLGQTTFDLPDLTAIIGMKTNLGIPASAKATIVPVKNRKEIKTTAIVKDLTFPYSPYPSQSDTVTNSLSFNFNDILNSKCDSLKINLALNSDKGRDCRIVPAANYTLGLGYDVSVPLQLGAGTEVIYTETLDLEGGLSGLQDILSNSSFGVTGNIESTFPFGVRVLMEFLSFDESRQVYSTLPLRPIDTELIIPNSESSFEIITGPQNPGTALPDITHLRIKVIFTADGKPIVPESYLKLKNFSIVLPEGVTIKNNQ